MTASGLQRWVWTRERSGFSTLTRSLAGRRRGNQSFKPNIHALEPVANSLKTLWSRNHFKSSRICLLLQDRCALQFQVNMEHPSTSQEECMDLLKFKLKKSIPFRIEEARINFWNPSGVPDFRATSLWRL